MSDQTTQTKAQTKVLTIIPVFNNRDTIRGVVESALDAGLEVLVVNDALGIGDYWPSFSKQYAQIGEIIQQAVARFKAEVVNREFP